jgi:hypothetical protein
MAGQVRYARHHSPEIWDEAMSKTLDHLCERLEQTPTKESFKTYKARVEMALVNRFVADRMNYWPARDVALNIVNRKTSELRKLYNRGTAPREAGMLVHPPL